MGSQVTLDHRVDVRGTPGGSISVTATAGDVVFTDYLLAEGQNGSGGPVSISATGSIANGASQGYVLCNGYGGTGGTVTLSAGGPIDVYRVYTRGDTGGSITATGASLDLGHVSTRGQTGGSAMLSGAAGSVTMFRYDGRGSSTTGAFLSVGSAANIDITEILCDGGTTGGEVRLDAFGNVILGANAFDRFDVSATTTGGTFEAVANGNLTTGSIFSAAPGGCIGLSAGGVLNTAGANFDVPVTASCP
jgi:hypothetical protein